MNYDTELKNYFTAAWNQFLKENPGSNQQAWYMQNGPSLKSYFDTLYQQEQTQPPAVAAPAQPQQPAASQQEINQLNSALDNIMQSENVDRDTAGRILRNEIPRPSDGARTPAAGTGTGTIKEKPGLDWETLEEQKRAAQEQEKIAREKIAFDQGMAVGKVGGVNTLESVKYSNDLLANPRNAALNEQVRKGFALGDVPGQTVADYLNRSVDKPVANIPGGAYGFDSNEEAIAMAQARDEWKNKIASRYGDKLPEDIDARWANMLSGVQQVAESGNRVRDKMSAGNVSDEEIRKFYMLLGGNNGRNVKEMRAEIENMKFSREQGSGDESSEADTGLRQTIEAYNPDWYASAENPAGYEDINSPESAYQNWLSQQAAGGPPAISGRGRLSNDPREVLARGSVDESTGGGGIPDWIHAHNKKTNWMDAREARQVPGQAGGGMVVGGQPHWIVDNQGNPQAAITEDGKDEKVVGKGGVEVVPMTEPRKSNYMASKKKNVPGAQAGMRIGNSKRMAPSRRPGGAAGNRNRTLSGSRATLPGGAIASTKTPATDGRAANGMTNNGRQDMAGTPRQAVSDRDAASVLPATGKPTLQAQGEMLRQKLQTQAPQMVNVQGSGGSTITPSRPGVFTTPGQVGGPPAHAPAWGWRAKQPPTMRTEPFDPNKMRVTDGPGMLGKPVLTGPSTVGREAPPRMPPPEQVAPSFLGKSAMELLGKPLIGSIAQRLFMIDPELARSMHGKPISAAIIQRIFGAPTPGPVAYNDVTSAVPSVPGARRGMRFNADFAAGIKKAISGANPAARRAHAAEERTTWKDVGPAGSSERRYQQTMRAAANDEKLLAMGKTMDNYKAKRAASAAARTASGAPPAGTPYHDLGGGKWEPVGTSAPTAAVATPPVQPVAPVATPPQAVPSVAAPAASAPAAVNPVAPAPPTMIASGATDRMLNNNIGSARFGFDSAAPSYIAGRNTAMGVKNQPGMSVAQGWKFSPQVLRNMTDEDRKLLESYISATGQDPAQFWQMASYAEPGQATTNRTFI